MNFNNDFRYDLEIGKEGERIVDSLFKDKRIEVKRDSWVGRTGNIAIEYESRGKPSGIATTKAEYWIIIFSREYDDKVMLVLETERLKEVARRYLLNKEIKKMGDSNTSLCVLIPLAEISNFQTKI
ncbi:MAG TPA: hypothetical protein EYO58_07495 [Flavobacteriales bacterium]|nr:hypothetical protein [Flavobacteriales bacterium]